MRGTRLQHSRTCDTQGAGSSEGTPQQHQDLNPSNELQEGEKGCSMPGGTSYQSIQELNLTLNWKKSVYMVYLNFMSSSIPVLTCIETELARALFLGAQRY